MIYPAPTVTVPGPPTVKEGSLHHTVRLAPDVTGVTTGTPLVPSPEGYRPSFQGVLFSAKGGVGGEEVVAYTNCIVEFHDRAFTPGVYHTVTEIDFYGSLTLDPPPPVRTAAIPPPPPTGGEAEAEAASVPGEASTAPSTPAASREAGARSARTSSADAPAARSGVAPAVTSVPGSYLALDEFHLRFMGS